MGRQEESLLLLGLCQDKSGIESGTQEASKKWEGQIKKEAHGHAHKRLKL